MMKGERLAFDELFKQQSLKQMSSDELAGIIEKLQKAKCFAQKREKAYREQREHEEARRREEEKKRQKDAHIQEVTSMDLPLDWENAFNQDVRTQGVHADSISDGLILSLANLGMVNIEYISAITGENYKTII